MKERERVKPAAHKISSQASATLIDTDASNEIELIDIDTDKNSDQIIR